MLMSSLREGNATAVAATKIRLVTPPLAAGMSSVTEEVGTPMSVETVTDDEEEEDELLATEVATD
jgi:hypothetical protein